MTSKENISLKEEILIDRYDDNDEYKFKLDNFEGPLDLLLHLIKKTELDINDIKLSLITEQYLDYMVDIESIDVSRAIRFIEVAATLIEIKSKSLLPDHEIEVDDEIDHEAMLLKNIKEYKLFKDITEELKSTENVDKFYRSSDNNFLETNFVLEDINLENMISVFSKLLTKMSMNKPEKMQKYIYKDRFDADECVRKIEMAVESNGKITFSSLIENDFSKLEVITFFLSVLELLKKQKILVLQDGQKDDFVIKPYIMEEKWKILPIFLSQYCLYLETP